MSAAVMEQRPQMMARALGGDSDSFAILIEPLLDKDVRREFPNAFGWGAQHVMLMTSITMLGAIVLAIGGYLIVSKLLLK